MKGRRFEISQETSILIHSLYDESLEIMRDNGYFDLSDPSKDFHRYYIRLAYEDCFNGDSRKYDKDRISDTDVEILSTAYNLSLGTYLGKPVGMINILSPDEHIARVVNRLRTIDRFNNPKLRVIPTRNDLRSFLK